MPLAPPLTLCRTTARGSHFSASHSSAISSAHGLSNLSRWTLGWTLSAEMGMYSIFAAPNVCLLSMALSFKGFDGLTETRANLAQRFRPLHRLRRIGGGMARDLFQHGVAHPEGLDRGLHLF